MKKKYLAYYETEWPANIAELTAVENKPFVGYLKDAGILFTVVPKPATEPSDNEIWYTSSDGNVVTPYNTNAFGVNIVSNTYENGKGVITFDNSVTSIGYGAFEGCTGLTSITIPNSLTLIGYGAFAGCSLTSPVYNTHYFVYMPTSFEGAYTIPEGIKQISSSAFGDCSSLTSITIPNSVTSIGNQAFRACSSLASVTIGNGVTRIEYMAFAYCSALTSITFEGTMEEWNNITKESHWEAEVPATYVQCSDGQVAL